MTKKNGAQNRQRYLSNSAMSVMLASLCIALGSGASAQERADQINIGPGRLSDVLVQYAAQTGTHLVFNPASLGAQTSQGLKGRYSVQQGFAELLNGSGYILQPAGPGAFVLRAAGDQSSLDTDDGTVNLGTIILHGPLQSTFSSPDSTSVVTGENLERVPPATPGDMLRGVPGVLAVNNRSTASIDPMIRGSQGMGRVSVVVDGVESGSSSYKGYAGTSQQFYVDPDFITGISVEKTPGRRGGDAIGGRIEMRSLSADELIIGDKTWGVRTRLSFGDNSGDGSAFDVCTPSGPGLPEHCLTPGTFAFDPARRAGIPYHDMSASVIAGWRPSEQLELVMGYARRESGNYNAGSKGELDHTTLSPDGTPVSTWPVSIYDPGQEIFGTYRETESYLLKGRADLGSGHALSFSVSTYDLWGGTFRGTNAESAYTFNPYLPASTTKQRNLGLSYEWAPEDNDLVNLKLDFWQGSIEEFRAAFGQQADTTNTGLRIYNESRFELAGREVRLGFGGQFSREDLTTRSVYGLGAAAWEFTGGTQDKTAVHIELATYLTPWLTLEAGLRHDRYEMKRDPGAETGMNYSGIEAGEASGSSASFRAVAQLPWEGAQTWFAYNEGWRAPVMRELILRNANPGGIPIRPETLRGYELGASFARNNLFAEGDFLGAKLSWFDNQYSDYITGNGFIPGFANMPSLSHRGFELALNYDSGPFYVEYGLTRYTKAEICGMPLIPTFNDMIGCNGGRMATGDAIGVPVVPKSLHSLTLGTRQLDGALDLGVRITKASDSAFSMETPVMFGGGSIAELSHPYTLVDVFARYDVTEKVRVDFSVENLTDKFYIDAATGYSNAVPAPGRTVRVGLTANF